MQPSYDVQFGDPKQQGLTSLLHHLIDRELKSIGIALLARESAKLAREDAVVGVVNVAIDDVAGPFTYFALTNEIGDRADGVQVLARKQSQRILVRDTFRRHDPFVDVAQFRVSEGKTHLVTGRHNSHKKEIIYVAYRDLPAPGLDGCRDAADILTYLFHLWMYFLN